MSVELPSAHGAKRTPDGVELLRGDFGRTLAEVQATGLLPELPPAWAASFCAEGFAHSDTANTRPGRGWRTADGGYQHGAFHELGWYQSKGGHIVWRRADDGTVHVDSAPGPSAEYNDWRANARDAEVMRALGGRPVNLAPGAWRTAYRDQHAVGLAMLRDDYKSIVRALPRELQPTSRASAWALNLMFMSFSAGPSRAAGVVRAWAPRLVGVPEDDRFNTLVTTAARDYASGARKASGRAGKHADNPAHTIVRQLQKAECARLIADATGTGAMPVPLGAAERVLCAADQHARIKPEDAQEVLAA